MTISGVGGMSFSRNPAASMVKTLDTDGSGGLSKSELEKVKAPRGAPSADELVAKGDEDGDEELSMEELTRLFAEMRPEGASPGMPLPLGVLRPRRAGRAEWSPGRRTPQPRATPPMRIRTGRCPNKSGSRTPS